MTTTVLTCKPDIDWAISDGELLLSECILGHGWNIASLIVPYQGWDFRIQRQCNAGDVSPQIDFLPT
jgi:hypothetical protein